MRANLLSLTGLFSLALVFFSCKKESEEFSSDTISDYLPMTAGKYITYRTDSTVFVNFGRNTEIHSYQEKHVVDASLTDNLGRTGYRILRFIRDTAGTQPWKPSGSHFIVPLEQTAELVENNLRVLKLSLPIKQDNSWKGNRYLANDPYGAFFSFSNDDNMMDWDYTYTGVGESIVLKGQTLDDVITVVQVDEAINVPITAPTAYASINYAIDRYAKGIGLVEQELTMWEYQPNPGGPSPYKIGFGIKRSMIDHN